MIDLLAELVPFYIWRYNGAVQAVNFPEQNYNQVGASGPCPHCSVNSLFEPVASNRYGLQIISAAQCVTCKKFVLVIGQRGAAANAPASTVTVYPMGKPNDTVAPEVLQAAKGVGEDFAEALRCQWINSYKACVVMCARAIQGSAIALGAKKKKLTDQIDELAAQAKITEPLKEFAHEIRVTRNMGAHPDKDGLEEVTEQDAKDIVEFTASTCTTFTSCPPNSKRVRLRHRLRNQVRRVSYGYFGPDHSGYFVAFVAVLTRHFSGFVRLY
jgi:hypothetical protein